MGVLPALHWGLPCLWAFLLLHLLPTPSGPHNSFSERQKQKHSQTHQEALECDRIGFLGCCFMASGPLGKGQVLLLSPSACL